MSRVLRRVVLIGLIGLSAAACQAQANGRMPSGQSLPAAAASQSDRPELPDFTVKTLDGGEAKLAKYRGRVVILDLFASWCPPCKMEIPQFVAMQKQYADRLTVVGLSYDQGSASDLRAFLTEMKVNYDVYWGSEEIAGYVGLRGIPHTLVLDARGRVRRSYVGFTPREPFEADLKALSAEAGGKP
jgi:thiol-disulfide isomerase/thioredoxin